MINVRRNVWELGGDWADDILWYARGVKEMQSRALAEPTSWRFYGAIHGFNAALWTKLGYLSPNDPMPSGTLRGQFWLQCQHGSWYFLPWHRGYVLAFEANIRAIVSSLGGPSDWTLPYWNYFKTGQDALPPAFGSPQWPDGATDNPLFVTQRYGPNNNGNVFIPADQVNLDAMSDTIFTGVASGGSPGFGGVDTGFSHSGNVHGDLESQPHDMVHVLIGGQDPVSLVGGLMSDPRTAGLDPIFWLHHANIDRLWESWNQSSPTHLDPTNPKWINGPASVGERPFVMPMPNATSWTYTPGEVTDINKLGYVYDDLTPGDTLIVVPVVQERRIPMITEPGDPPMEDATNVELFAANSEEIPVLGEETHSHVRLDTKMRRKVAARLSATGTETTETTVPERVLLNLENVRGNDSDATALRVYIGVPDDADVADHPECLAGNIGLFGLHNATQPDDEHAGQGLTYVLDVTKIIKDLHRNETFDVETLPVRIVTKSPVNEGAQLRIGRISLFRQGR